MIVIHLGSEMIFSIVTPLIKVHALISENHMFWGCFEIILCSKSKCMHLFSKTKHTPILSDFVAHYDTLNNSVINLCLYGFRFVIIHI